MIKNVKQKLKKIMAVCFGLVMCLTGFGENVQASSSPIIYLSGLKGTYASDGSRNNCDDTEYFSALENLYRYGNPNATVYKRDYFRSLSDLEGMLRNGNYVWVSTHGSSGKIATYNSAGYCNGSISVSDFLKYDVDEFSNVKLCVILACQSAGTNLNVCNAIQQRGAECVIGFEKSIEGETAKKWQRYFVDAQAVGWPVSAAVRYADSMVYTESDDETTTADPYGMLNSHVIYGNANLIYTED